MARSTINPDCTDYLVTPTGLTVYGRTKVYPNIDKRDMDSYSHFVQFAWVQDATKDPTVNEGAALYKRNDDGTWTKLYETESMDVVVTEGGTATHIDWENILNKPNLALADHNHDAVYAKLNHQHYNYADKETTETRLSELDDRLSDVEEEVLNANQAIDRLIGVL